MNVVLEESYCEWLYSLVGNTKARGRSKTYRTLMWQLFTTEFIWLIPNDDNRWEDGRDLRYEFLVESEIPDVHQEFMELSCCVLEMMIALSRRLAFQTDTPVEAWFWHILHNMGLAHCNDAADDFTDYVTEILRQLVWRDYEASGKGGMFPLRKPERDQRQVEIWYQMCAYILENS